MAFRLERNERPEWEALVRELAAAASAVEREEREAAAAVATALERLNQRVRVYNAAAAAAGRLAERVAERLRDELDERSEKWREGERGQAAESFVDEWESVEADAVGEAVLPDLDRVGLACRQHADRTRQVPLEADR